MSNRKPIYIKKNKQAINLLRFYFDPVYIENIDEKHVKLSSAIKYIPKPLRRHIKNEF